MVAARALAISVRAESNCKPRKASLAAATAQATDANKQLTVAEAQSAWSVDFSELRRPDRIERATTQGVSSKACDLWIKSMRTDIAKECFDLQAASGRQASREEYRMLFFESPQ